jgi:acyl-coenzyme A synthetase/AMP-(fatty) acid ligase
VDWLIDRMRSFAGKPALAEGGTIYTYAQLASRIEEHSASLTARGVQPGRVVALVAEYSFDAIALFFALARNRAIVVPVTTGVGGDLEDRFAEAFVDDVIRIEDGISIHPGPPRAGGTHALVQRLRDAGHAGLVLFSSGSVGKPKAMLHDFDNLADHYRARPARDSVMMVFLMFDHIGGMNTLLNCLAMGALMVIPDSRAPERVCSLIEQHKVQILPASPTFLNLVIISEAFRHHDLSSLRLVTYGTEPMPESLLLRLSEAFPGAKYLQTFGTSETGIARTSSLSSSSTLMKIDDPDQEYKIVEGELWLRSKTQILGYLNAPMDGFTDDGWFKTGDLVETAADGFLRIVGRRTEVINVGGQKVMPGEVESALLTAPGVEDCMVYGEANALTGQTVAADVVLGTPQPPLETKKALRIFLRGKLDAYKIPTRINVVDRTNFNQRFKKIRRKDGAPPGRGRENC